MSRTIDHLAAVKTTALVLISGAVLAACASEPAPLPPAPIAAHAVAPPPVALSSRVVENASEFRLYMARAGAISPVFKSGPAIEQTLTTAEGYEAQQLSRGAIAYAAVVALQEPGFVASVRTYAVDPTQRRELAQRLISDPNYAQVLPGAPAAAGLIIASLNAQAAKVRGVGELVKQSAYDVQHQAWSKGFITDPEGRLAAAKSVAATPMEPEARDVSELQDAANHGSDSSVASRRLLVSGIAAAPPYTPVVTRGLAIAALAALGEAGDENDAQIQGLLSESNSGFCLNMSKLNLNQCLAVAKPWYEDVFCLGQHVLIDTGQCIAKAAGQPNPVPSAAAGPATTGAAMMTPMPGTAPAGDR
jgi:hypothetical protein